MCVRTLKGKQLELSTPNVVHIYSMTVAQHALTWMSKGQRSRSHGYKNSHGCTVTVGGLLPAAAAAGMGLHVMSAQVSVFSSSVHLPYSSVTVYAAVHWLWCIYVC